jgi:hypothetical protein
MKLRNPGGVDHALSELWALKLRLDDCLTVSPSFGTCHEYYKSWIDTADAQLRSIFDDTALADQLVTTAYWELNRGATAFPPPWDILRREVRFNDAHLVAAVERLRELKAFIDRPGSIVVPDTSALVRGEYFTDFDWGGIPNVDVPVRLILPIAVVAELDKLKDFDRGKAQKRARSVLKRLRELTRAVAPGAPAPVRQGVSIEVLIDDGWHQPRPSPDAEIIDQALSVQNLAGKDVMLTCVDAQMEFRARQAGLKVFEMPVPEDGASEQ